MQVKAPKYIHTISVEGSGNLEDCRKKDDKCPAIDCNDTSKECLVKLNDPVEDHIVNLASINRFDNYVRIEHTTTFTRTGGKAVLYSSPKHALGSKPLIYAAPPVYDSSNADHDNNIDLKFENVIFYISGFHYGSAFLRVSECDLYFTSCEVIHIPTHVLSPASSMNNLASVFNFNFVRFETPLNGEFYVNDLSIKNLRVKKALFTSSEYDLVNINALVMNNVTLESYLYYTNTEIFFTLSSSTISDIRGKTDLFYLLVESAEIINTVFQNVYFDCHYCFCLYLNSNPLPSRFLTINFAIVKINDSDFLNITSGAISLMNVYYTINSCEFTNPTSCYKASSCPDPQVISYEECDMISFDISMIFIKTSAFGSVTKSTFRGTNVPAINLNNTHRHRLLLTENTFDDNFYPYLGTMQVCICFFLKCVMGFVMICFVLPYLFKRLY
jgi:hypothetical protein